MNKMGNPLYKSLRPKRLVNIIYSWLQGIPSVSHVEINKENREKGDDTRLRSYFCDECKGYHLSSMTKEEFKKYDPYHKALKRKERFIQRETTYWEQKLGIDM